MRDEAKFRDSARARYFTGLDDYDRQTLRLFLGKDMPNLKMIDQDRLSGSMPISIECQFLLTLTILRRNYDYGEAAHIFGLATEENAKSDQAYSIASRIFRTWLFFMYRKFHDREFRQRMFVEKKDLPKLPLDFQNEMLENVRAVIDVTSITIEKPGNLQKQSNTFSTYKQDNVVNLLIATTPAGGMAYMSAPFEGAISDRYYPYVT